MSRLHQLAESRGRLPPMSPAAASRANRCASRANPCAGPGQRSPPTSCRLDPPFCRALPLAVIPRLRLPIRLA